MARPLSSPRQVFLPLILVHQQHWVPPSIFADTSTVVVTSVTADSVAGTFNLTLDTLESVTGTFSVDLN